MSEESPMSFNGSVIDELRDQRKLLTAMEVNLGIMLEHQKQQIMLNDEARRFSREIADFKTDMNRRLTEVERRDRNEEIGIADRRDAHRFRLNLLTVILGGGLLQAIVQHYWK